MCDIRVNEQARVDLYEKIAKRFISPKIRKARVEAAWRAAGYKSMSQFAEDNGMYPSSVQKILDSPRPSIMGIYRIAVALDVSINYLTEEKVWTRRKQREDDDADPGT